jgi:hypothetical protein
MKACCFTGHRDLPKGEAERLTEKARALILLLIQEGEFPRGLPYFLATPSFKEE